VETPDKKDVVKPGMILFLVLAGIVAAVIYAPGIAAPFYLDDAIVLGNAEGLISTRTLGYASFWVSHQLASALGFVLPWDVTIYYRIPNVLIHVLAAMAVFWLARELTGRRITAGLAGALFLVHPIQTQAVTYISQRFESQAALFMILAAASYIRFRKGHSRWWAGATVVFGLAAGMTKETAVALPLWIGVIEVIFFSGIPRLKHVALWLPFVAALAYPALKAVNSAGKTLTWIPFELYLLSQGPVLLKYLQLIFIPGRQFLLYDFPPASGLTAHVLSSWGLLLSLIGMALYLVRRNPVAVFGILTFFILLSPTSVVPIPDLIFEHRVYPAFAGLAIALASIFPPRRLTVALFSVVFVLLGYRAGVRNNEWNDRIRFYEAHREAFPRDVKVLASLGASYALEGQVKNAIAANLEARKYLDTLNPFYRKANATIVDMNLAILYTQMGDRARAIQQARRVLSVDPTQLTSLQILSRAQVELGEYEEALKTLQRTLALVPGDSESLYRLREVEKALGHAAEFAAIDTRIRDMEAKAKELAEKTSAGGVKEPQDRRSQYLTPILFGFLVGGFGLLVFIFLVFKRHLSEVIRWVRTGSTVSVDSAAAGSTETVGRLP
jgi:tetratricopeptide (TPR) repeat protein